MLDDAQTQQFRRHPVTAAPAAPWAAWPVPAQHAPGPWAPAPWGPPPAGLDGPAPLAPLGSVAPTRRPRWPWILGAVAAVVVVLGLSGSVLAPSTTVSGTVTFYASNYLAVGSSCEGSGSYGFLTPGGSVSVYDDAGALVGTGALSSGVTTNSGTYGTSYGDACVFTYSVTDVPASDHYRVKVGNGSDTGVPFTADDVDGNAHIRFGTP